MMLVIQIVFLKQRQITKLLFKKKNNVSIWKEEMNNKTKIIEIKRTRWAKNNNVNATGVEF